MFRVILICSFVLFTTACAVTSSKTPNQLKQEGKAIVLGVEVNFFKEVLVPIGTKTNLKFLEVNNKPFDWSLERGYQPSSIELTPGIHSLTVVCRGDADRIKFEHKVSNYQIDVKAGHIYQMVAHGSLGGCKVSHKDVTNEQNR